MSGGRWIRWATAAVVLAVAAFAAVVSYSHIYGLGRAHGQAGTAARLLPLSVDGLILAAGLVLLHAARAGLPAPGLARVCLWLGISATVGANVAYGARYGLLGAVISAWPAIAFIGSAEMALGMIRTARAAPEIRQHLTDLDLGQAALLPDSSAAVPAPEPVPVPVPDVAPELNGHREQAADLFAAELAAGDVPSIRRIRAEMHVGQPRAQQVRDYLADLARTRADDPEVSS